MERFSPDQFESRGRVVGIAAKPLILGLPEHVNSSGNSFPIVRVHVAAAISISECGAPSCSRETRHCFKSAASRAETAALLGLQLKAKKVVSVSENSGLSDPF